MDCEHGTEEERNVKNEQKGLLVILASLVVISAIVVIGVFIFFPFDTHSKPSVIVEKGLSNQAQEKIVNENRFLSNLEQNKASSPKLNENHASAEEFFIEILPESEEEKPASLTQPIKADPPITAKLDSTPDSSRRTDCKKTPVATKSPTRAKSDGYEAPKVKNQEKMPATSKTNSPSFWIQLGSYSDEKLADNVIMKIKQEGFEACKLKFNDGSRTLFRVRMGPYSSKKEASKFLTWIQELPDFKTSYILQANT